MRDTTPLRRTSGEDGRVHCQWCPTGLIDPYKPAVYIYPPGQPVKHCDNPASISGEPVLPGFVFDVAEIW